MPRLPQNMLNKQIKHANQIPPSLSPSIGENYKNYESDNEEVVQRPGALLERLLLEGPYQYNYQLVKLLVVIK